MLPVAVYRACTGAGDDGVLHVGSADDGRERRVVLDGALGFFGGGLLEQLGDHDGEHLDVAHLLGTDTVEQVAVLAGNVRVPRLEAVLHRDGDFTVLTSQHLLEFAGEKRVWLIGGGAVLQFLTVKKHLHSLLH
jgi:hypothetical protein